MTSSPQGFKKLASKYITNMKCDPSRQGDDFHSNESVIEESCNMMLALQVHMAHSPNHSQIYY